MSIHKTVIILALGFFGLQLSSCTIRSSQQPSVLVILVADLGFGAFSCGEGAASAGAGFQVFCDEAVRFTHTYAPSTMVQPNVVSIMTGKYPFEHGVRHNGAQGLLAKEETIAEVAQNSGYRTAFFSGGPPIFRRSGVNQGFVTFDDAIQPRLGRTYRTAPDVASAFLSWQDSEAPRGRFFATLFLADPQFIDSPTINRLGELRESSYQSQLDEVDETLGDLVREMKKRKIWDSTDVLLIGVSASPEEVRPQAVSSVHLLSEGTHMTLMVKPSRKTRDGPFNWKIDGNVSLVDVGATLLALINDGRRPAKRSVLDTTSLVSALKGPEPEWNEDRIILSESAWAAWRGLGGVRAGLRQGPYLYLFDEREALYNTLTDNLEATPLPASEGSVRELKMRWSGLLSKYGFQRWQSLSRVESEKLILARDLWRDRPLGGENLARLRQLSSRFPNDEELRGWRAIMALRQSNWNELKQIAEKPQLQSVWAYVASRNLGEKAVLPDDSCLAFLKPGVSGESRKLPKTCREEGLQHLLVWIDESAGENVRKAAQEAFLRLYVQRALALRIAEYDLVRGRVWDVSTMLREPDLTDLLLSLPEFKRYRQVVRARVTLERKL